MALSSRSTTQSSHTPLRSNDEARSAGAICALGESLCELRKKQIDPLLAPP
jgi:hypothetical protein